MPKPPTRVKTSRTISHDCQYGTCFAGFGAYSRQLTERHAGYTGRLAPQRASTQLLRLANALLNIRQKKGLPTRLAMR
jgi:hypothetical protein